MSICCPKSIKGLAIRVTRTDICGVPESIFDADTRITTTGFVSLGLTPNIESGEEITVKNADGSLCVTDKDPDQLKWFDLELLLCGVPLPLLEMLLGVTLLTDGADSVGGVLPSRAAQIDQLPRQMEVWSRNKDAAACAPGATPVPYVQWLLPLTRNWNVSGNLSFSITQLEFTLSGQAEETQGYQPSHGGEWDAGQVAAIQNGGPLAWKCVGELPTTSDCAYYGIGSGA